MKILLVDDEPDVLASVKEGLERQEFVVDAFDDPLEALRRLKRKYNDVALLDVRMPNLNGFQLYREILKLDST